MFRGIQQSFSLPVKWVTIDGKQVDFDLADGEPKRGADLQQALLFLDFKILRRDGEPEGRTVSSPRVIVRNSQEIINSFALSPDSGLTYQLRTTPRIEAGGKITIDVDLVFRRIGETDGKEARLFALSSLTPGKVAVLGSVLPGNELYQIEVLATVEQINPFLPSEKI